MVYFRQSTILLSKWISESLKHREIKLSYIASNNFLFNKPVIASFKNYLKIFIKAKLSNQKQIVVLIISIKLGKSNNIPWVFRSE